MNRAEAKRILALHRPTVVEPEEVSQVWEALAIARNDGELREWYEQHLRVQDSLRRKFRSIQSPPDLENAIVSSRPRERRRSVSPKYLWVAAAAGLAILATLAALWVRPRVPDRFGDFRERMVRLALREYRMDIKTNDMTQVRQFMIQRGTPADYSLTPGLERLSLTGGGALTWRTNPVSMVCFDRGDRKMVFLFVIENQAFVDPPALTPTSQRVNKLLTVSWSAHGKSYVLAGFEEPDFAQKYL